jgi:hypothetical protein
MSLELPYGLKRVTSGPEIERYYNNSGEPYTNVAQVLSEVTSTRYIGQTFCVAPGEEYWFKTGVSDADLVPKNDSFLNALIFG